MVDAVLAQYENHSLKTQFGEFPVAVVSRWIMIQNKVASGSQTVSFSQNWDAYRDGFGSPVLDDNYWIGLELIYRLVSNGVQLKLRVEVVVVVVVVADVDLFGAF